MLSLKRLFTGSVAWVAVTIAACGGSSEAPPGTAIDSGPSGDGTAPAGDSSLADGGSEDASEDACVTDADLLTATPTDAALNTSGASVGTCIACAQTHCSKQIDTCNGDCVCANEFTNIFDCLGGVGGSLISCYIQYGGSLGGGSSADPAETALGECAIKTCAAECALCQLSAKLCPDAGAPPPADAGADASADAAVDASGDAAADATGD